MAQQDTIPTHDGLSGLDPLRAERARALAVWLNTSGEVLINPGFFEVCRSCIGMDRGAAELATSDASEAGLVNLKQVIANDTGVPSMLLCV